MLLTDIHKCHDRVEMTKIKTPSALNDNNKDGKKKKITKTKQ